MPPVADTYHAYYQTLIDRETWSFIERTNAFYPADTADRDIEQQRLSYRTMCQSFYHGRPESVQVNDQRLPGPYGDIPVRRYRVDTPCTATILYFHGGGFVVGDLDSHDDVCAELCHRSGLSLMSVDYRLAPEHQHPVAFREALTCYEWLADQVTNRVILCGDSAGANLAAAVAHATREHDVPPRGQVLIYPGLGGDMTTGSYQKHAQAPLLTLADVRFYDSIRGDHPTDPTLWPLRATSFSRLPVTVVFAAECDPLCDDGSTYCSRINAAGGQAELRVESGLVHGYLRARHTVGRASDSFARISDSLRQLARSAKDPSA